VTKPDPLAISPGTGSRKFLPEALFGGINDPAVLAPGHRRKSVDLAGAFSQNVLHRDPSCYEGIGDRGGKALLLNVSRLAKLAREEEPTGKITGIR
jgi:hypothetical protein